MTIGEGFIYFDEIIKILKTASFEFPLLLEMMKTYSKYKDTEEFLSMAYSGAYDIMEKIND